MRVKVSNGWVKIAKLPRSNKLIKIIKRKREQKMIIKCPSCAAQFDIDKSLKGEAVNCPDCGKAFVAGKKTDLF